MPTERPAESQASAIATRQARVPGEQSQPRRGARLRLVKRDDPQRQSRHGGIDGVLGHADFQQPRQHPRQIYRADDRASSKANRPERNLKSFNSA